MTKNLIKALVLLIVFGTGCSESGTPLNNDVVNTSNTPGINGRHAGEIWIARWSGSERFNLQTGVQTEVSKGVAIPSRDGTMFLEHLPDHGIIQHDYCPIAPSYYDAQVFSVKNTRTEEVYGTFTLGVAIGATLRLSPDGNRIAMYTAEDTMRCDDNDSNKRFTVYSKDGEQLYRKTDGHFASFDWHPDGRLVVLQRVTETDRGFAVQIETKPGSYEFVDLFSFNAPPDVRFYRGLRVGPTGTDAVLEAVTQTPTPLAGVFYRDAKSHHFPLFIEEDGGLGETDLFEHTDGVARVNGPTFSPDGKHILLTEGYSSGAFVFFQHYPPLNVIDALGVVPFSAGSASYIVPVDVKAQPMPPVEYSENIRPVIKDQFGQRGVVGFYPLEHLSWTPVVD